MVPTASSVIEDTLVLMYSFCEYVKDISFYRKPILKLNTMNYTVLVHFSLKVNSELDFSLPYFKICLSAFKSYTYIQR